MSWHESINLTTGNLDGRLPILSLQDANTNAARFSKSGSAIDMAITVSRPVSDSLAVGIDVWMIHLGSKFELVTHTG